MPVRLIVGITDCGAAANVGGPVDCSYRTFDIDHPELETILREAQSRRYRHAQVTGAEVIDSASSLISS